MSLFLFLLLTCLRLHGVFADTEEVSVMEGDSVTLNTGVQTNQHYLISWYYNDILIARINGDLSKICTDVQCEERFRDRVKLDHQTGSLTIMNTRIPDSGEYELQIINISSISISEKIFRVSVHGVFADTEEVSVMEGDSVTLNTGVKTNQHYLISWYYNDILIARINGDLSKICTDVQCEERFRDRVKLDHQTGSLTIMNTRIPDSGEYELQIINISSISISEKIFRVSVHALPDLDLGSGSDPTPFLTELYVAAAVSVSAAVIAILLIVAVICCCKRRARRKGNKAKRDKQASGAEDSSPDQRDTFLMKNLSDSNLHQTEAEAANETPS